MGADYKTRELSADDFADWDRLVEESLQGTIFNTTDWLRICAETWRGKLRIWGCFRNDELVGGCALRVLNLGFLKRAAMSGLMTPYDGVILKSLPKEAKLSRIESFYKKVIISLCSKLEKLSFVRLVNNPALLDIRPFTWREWDSKVRYIYHFKFSNATLNHFAKAIRRQIRKAEKYDLRVERSNDGFEYFKLYKSMLLRKHAPPPAAKLKLFFQQIVELLNQKNLGELWFAKTPSDEIAAGRINVFDNKRAYGWSSTSSGDHLHTGASSFLLYETIKHLRDRFNEIDIAGADYLGAEHHFAQFNPTLVPCYIVEKSSLTAGALYSLLKRADNLKRFITQ